MDYMTELAIKVLPWFAPGWSDSETTPDHVRLEFIGDLEKGICEVPSARQVWTHGSDQARLELLVDYMYGNPKKAQKATELVHAYPTFIRNLADEIRGNKDNPRLAGLQTALFPAKVTEDKASIRSRIKRVFTDEHVVSDRIEHMLMGDPALVMATAKRLEVAVPFSLILNRELKEIVASRALRTVPDNEAELTQIRDKLNEVTETLAQCHSVGNASSFQSRVSALKDRKKVLEGRLSVILEIQKEQRTVAKPPVTGSGGSGPSEDTATQPRYSLRRALEMDLLGVAFSGGGIRSATFNLGVLQALAEMDLLRKVDYISTVSGGGYIGSWLVNWIKRQSPDGIRRVQQFLSPVRSPNPEAEVVRPIRHLREYSNHVTPTPGFLSADTWTMIAIWLRNTVLNQTVLVLFLAGLLMLPRGLFPALFQLPVTYVVYAAAIAFIVACSAIGSNLRSFDSEGDNAGREPVSSDEPPTRFKQMSMALTRQGWVQKTVVIPLFVSAFLFSTALIRWMPPVDTPLISAASGDLNIGIRAALTLFAAQLFVVWQGRYYRCFYDHDNPPRRWRLAWAIGWLGFFTFISSTFGGLLVVTLRRMISPPAVNIAATGPEEWRAIVFGPPAFVMVLSLVIVLQVGLLGRNFPEERREWWGRLGAWLSIYMLGWLVLFAIPIYGPLALVRAGRWVTSAAAITWIGSTIAGVFAAKSAKSGVGSASAGLKSARVREAVAVVAPYVFIFGLLIAIATGIHLILLQRADPTFFATHHISDFAALDASYWEFVRPTDFADPLILSIIILIVSALLAARIGVNEFSMHHFYRNRLVRAYLGASRAAKDRKPNRFTGFDLADDEPLSAMTVSPTNGYVGPYPILNCALNFVKSDDLAFQERKAQSFIFSPFYCGYEFVDRRAEMKWNPKFTRDGYRPTDTYACASGTGIHLGTATAISGAAVNPNMGHHSSPAAAFLLTIFNARLGWWLGNPRHAKKWKHSSPDLGLLYLLKELTASTNDHSGFVNLSDGGHFDNLGVYELVRRRCRYIIVSDAEQDPELRFGSLGNAVRKCRTDFGVEIEIRLDRIQKLVSASFSTVHCAVGNITYPDGTRGKLLYMKSSLTGDEPADVLEYRARQPIFPQQSTADQLFDESQFESYRTLGYHVAKSTFRRAVEAPASVSLEDVFSHLETLWFPPGLSVQDCSAKHIASYQALLERVRADNRLMAFDGVLFSALPATLGIPPSAERRDTFYTCTAMMDLMQTVFLDLDLEENGMHPHNAGWIRIFHQWASQPVLQEAWAITKETYGERFRRFCKTELQLPY